MKKSLFLILFLCIVATVIAQPKSERRIYLWDVTLSMYGITCSKGEPNYATYNLKGDIYYDVKEFLIQDINLFEGNEDSEIIVLPFQEKILVDENDWTVKADKQGKMRIIQKIEDYPMQKCSNTNIVEPIKAVMEKFVKEGKSNYLYILTDGKQSGGNSELIKMIEAWGNSAKKTKAYALYVMLTKEAIDNDIIEACKKNDNIDVITQTFFLQPEPIVVFNINNDKGKLVNVELKSKGNIILPENIKIKVSAQNNPNLIANSDIFVKDNKISFSIRQSEAEAALSNELKMRIPLRLELQNREELKENGMLVLLNPDEIKLELTKNPEKKLIIRYE